MAIALADVADRPIFVQAVALAIVGVAITIAVYGVVALIVKMDDIGLHLAKRGAAATRKLGRGLVKAMPVVMQALAVIGTAAMLWVGGGILVGESLMRASDPEVALRALTGADERGAHPS